MSGRTVRMANTNHSVIVLSHAQHAVLVERPKTVILSLKGVTMHLYSNLTNCANCAQKIFASRNDYELVKYRSRMKTRTMRLLQILSWVKDLARRKDDVSQSKNVFKALNGRTVFTLVRLDSQA